MSTSDKSQLLSAATILVVKGFPEETFNQMKVIANSRRVTLLNENDYRKTLEEIIPSRIIGRSLDKRRIVRTRTGYRYV